jgi:2-polyprenyl-6-methoxyphenol hydroxylase-like FAD-dependent oxidoreductase
MTRATSETDVLVVGAGPTGLALAVDLRRRGVDCRLVERDDSSVETSRALAVQPRTLQVFDDLGVLDGVLTEGFRVEGATVAEGDTRLFRLDLDSLSSPYPFLWFLPQNRTERLLADRFDELGGTVEFETELVGFGQDDDGVTATVEHRDTGTTETVAARWLVGCDGAHSRVRETLGLPLEGTTEPEEVLVADVEADHLDVPRNEAGIWFHEEGVVAVLPMLGERRWRLFVDVTRLPPEARPTPIAETLQRLLRERTSLTDVTVADAPWTSSFVTNQRLVPQYRRGRVFLAGDSAHVHNPLGGQGMNLGVQDAYNLGWKLALALDAPEDDALLATYETERRPVAEGVIRTTGAGGSFLVSPNSVVERVREAALPLVFGGRRVQGRVFRAMTGLDVAYPDSPLSSVHVESAVAGLFDGSLGTTVARARRAWAAPKAGDRAPEGRLRTVDGQETTLYRTLHDDPSFALVLFGGERAAVETTSDLLALARRVDDHTGRQVRPFLVVTDESAVPTTGHDVTVLVDSSGGLHERYDATVPTAFLLRPDDYVGFRSRPARTAPLLAYLERWVPGVDHASVPSASSEPWVESTDERSPTSGPNSTGVGRGAE